MIARISGKLIYKESGFAVLDVHGVGYKIFASAETLGPLKIDSEVTLSTYLAVRENALELYGFSDEDSRSFFELVLAVPGIGPKSALAILNIAPVKTLRSAIASGDASHLTKTTGIGTKKAERIVMELKDKFELAEGEGSAHQDISDVIEALKALGYSQKEARDAVQKLSKETGTAEEKIKQALKVLGK